MTTLTKEPETTRQEPSWPTGPLVERFPITAPDGRKWEGSCHRTNSRPSGRRIVVRGEGGRIEFDTDEQYDLGNAVNLLDEWLRKEIA